MRRCAAPLLAVALLLPAAAAARPALQLGLRLAFAPAAGSAAALVPMSEAIRWQAPIQADGLVGAGAFAAGLYGSWGPAQAGTEPCADGATCSARVTRAGAQALWSFRRTPAGAAAWAGAGLGWEWATSRRERLGATTERGWDGPELSLQGGLDWRVKRAFAVGPFLLVGLGRYSGASVETGEESGARPIGERAVHAWFHLGVRGTADL